MAVTASGSKTNELSRVVALVDAWVDAGVVPGVSLAVVRGDQLILEHAAGKLSAGGGGPVTPDTLYSVASLTKPVTAAVVMRLIEDGRLYLDEPIRRWVPAFMSGPDADDTLRRNLTARELLCHVSGLPKDDPNETDLWAREASFADTAESAARLPLEHQPGTRVSYSNVGYWVLGAAAVAATDAPFAEMARDLVLAPAGISDDEATLRAEARLSERIARRYGPARIANAPYGRELGSPPGGMFATARAVARFAALFLPGSSRRVLSPATITAMTSDQTALAAGALPSSDPQPALNNAIIAGRAGRSLPGGIVGMREWSDCPWAFGWEVKGDKRSHWTGDLTSPRTISHLGQSGCLAWADLEANLAVAILANRDLGTGWATGDQPARSPGRPDTPARWPRLCNALVAALTSR